jgi:hypothetical protein
VRWQTQIKPKRVAGVKAMTTELTVHFSRHSADHPHDKSIHTQFDARVKAFK